MIETLPGRCPMTKLGKFDQLVCARPDGHEGPCNFVVFGVAPYEGEHEYVRVGSVRQFGRLGHRKLKDKGIKS